MFNEIHHYFQNSLSNTSLLKNIKLESINEILIQADNSKKYRPTLYDFLMHNAIDFYSTNESSITKPSNEFKIDNDKYFFDFEKLELIAADSLSPVRQALLLYQDLLAFHKQRRDTSAYLNLEIQRVTFIAGLEHLDQSQELHKKALALLKGNFKSHPASTLAAFELASLLNKEGNDYDAKTNKEPQFKKTEALDLCNQAISAFPTSDGAKECEALRELIRRQALSIVVEKYVPRKTPSFISIRYANVDSLYFSVYRISRELEERLNDAQQNDSITWSAIAALPAEKKWRVRLKNLNDYQSHATEVVLPDLSGGRFVVMASTSNKKEYDEQVFGFATLQVTNLALLEFSYENEHYYQVLDRNNGEPIDGAEVHLQSRNKNYGMPIDETLKTGKQGVATHKKLPRLLANAQATVRHAGDEASFGDYYVYPLSDGRNKEDDYVIARSFLFTDRSIYRPGQVVFFKGILIQTKNNKSSVVPGQYVTIYLDDANGSEVDSLRLKTNAYGSFSGEFKLPASGLTGEYTLYAEEDYEEDSRFYDNLDDFMYDELIISVEEYKRPTFETKFKPVKETFTLNDTARIAGIAEAFSGAKLSKAQVKYKVTRKVSWARYYNWTNFDYSPEAEITHGETLTDERGEFTIAFKAMPEDKASPEGKPVFVFEITADVTDISGETRSATTEIKVGYHAITATINALATVDLVKPDNTITLTTENLNGQFVGVSGKVEIFKLKAPDAPMRARPWEAPDLPLLSEAEFQKLFPHDVYSNASGPTNWPRQNRMAEIPFNTKVSREVKYRTDVNWPTGNYVIELTAVDSMGQSVKDLYQFTVTDTKNKVVADNALIIFELDKPSYKVGEVAKLRVGSAAPDITFYIHVEKDHKITRTYEEKFSSNTTVISIPITDEKGNGFSVSCRGVAYNAFVYKTINIPIVSASKTFEIETTTFKDKLQPGSKETWSFSIKGDDAGPQQAEVLASMYDASLDQFKPHQWNFDPVEEKPYFATVIINGHQSFGEQDFEIRNLVHRHPLGRFQYYDKLDWFGFTLTNNQLCEARVSEQTLFDRRSC